MPSSKAPLWLPAGSVRAIMTVTLVVVVCILCLTKQPVPEILSQALLLSIGLYHLGRSQDGKPVLIPVDDEDDSGETEESPS